jgi:hypothetical protein
MAPADTSSESIGVARAEGHMNDVMLATRNIRSQAAALVAASSYTSPECVDVARIQCGLQFAGPGRRRRPVWLLVPGI